MQLDLDRLLVHCVHVAASPSLKGRKRLGPKGFI